MMEKKERLTLLQKTQELIKVERSLTATLAKVEPWLTSNTINIPKVGKRVRPIPTTMEQVQQILAVGRNYASRISAPAGWNPMAPVVGFSTPNPLPHMLRGGALAALQLEGAKQAETDKKRKREEEEMEKAAAKKQKEEATSTTSTSQVPEANKKGYAPPRKEDEAARRRAAQQRQNQTKVVAATMNLSSDSSSSSEEEDSDED
jgi:hypothetical protein